MPISIQARFRGSIIVVGDTEPDVRPIAEALRSLADTRLLSVADAVAHRFDTTCDVIVVDQGRLGRSATRLLAEAPAVLRILVSSDGLGGPLLEHGDVTTLTKPVDLRALQALCAMGLRYAGAARTAHTLEDENRWLRGAPDLPSLPTPPDVDHYEGLLTRSPLMRRVLGLLRKLEGSDSPLMIQGEPGTGKELVARTIHARSRRHAAPFLSLSLGALSDEARERRLFGRVLAAGEGMRGRRDGLLAAADAGSFFLDQVGEASPALQVALLRVLDEGAVRPVGSTRDRRIDVRLMVGTSRDLERLVREGSFRRDLYDRLHVLRIDLPPLRERPEDIVVLAQHFLAQAARAMGRPTATIARDACALLEAQPWEGNLRELRSVMERAAILTKGGTILAAQLPFDAGRKPVSAGALGESILIPPGGASLQRLEQEIFLKTLALAGGNQSRAANILGLRESTFRFRLRKLGIASRRMRGARPQPTAYPQLAARA